MRPTEAEVRQHRDDLRTILAMPGHCGEDELLMKMMETQLTWVLEGHPDVERLVANTHKDAMSVHSRRN